MENNKDASQRTKADEDRSQKKREDVPIDLSHVSDKKGGVIEVD